MIFNTVPVAADYRFSLTLCEQQWQQQLSERISPRTQPGAGGRGSTGAPGAAVEHGQILHGDSTAHTPSPRDRWESSLTLLWEPPDVSGSCFKLLRKSESPQTSAPDMFLPCFGYSSSSLVSPCGCVRKDEGFPEGTGAAVEHPRAAEGYRVPTWAVGRVQHHRKWTGKCFTFVLITRVSHRWCQGISFA